MRRLRFISLIILHLGLRWFAYRLWYSALNRTGYLRWRAPIQQWADVGVPTGAEGRLPTPVPDIRRRISAVARDHWIATAERIRGGEMQLFFHQWITAGEDPLWHCNPLTQERAPADRHWSSLGEYNFGDIKNIWEPSRFGWAFPLACAYALTGDNRYAERFWTWFESWMRHNPPNAGINWKCGQEVALRLVAAAYARSVFADAAATTAGRVEQWRRFVAASAQRIDANIGYALSQKNNHGISECVGLVTASLLLPADPRAKAWWTKGMRHLQAQVCELVFGDGGFAQYSVNYHRLMLEDLIWLAQMLKANALPVPGWLSDAGTRATRWLEQLTNKSTGEAPCLGQNDGSWILPLSSGGYPDYRATVQAGALLFVGQRAYAQAVPDEMPLFLGIHPAGLQKPSADGAGGALLLEESGLGLLRSRDHLMTLRAMPRFRHRMRQADLLHVTLMLFDKPVILDPGTYSYNPQANRAGGPPLSALAYHNGPRVKSVEPFDRVGKFLYLPWPNGRLELISGPQPQNLGGILGAHDGYAWYGLQMTRSVVQLDYGHWRVVDKATGRRLVELEWYWLFANAPARLSAESRQLVLQLEHGEFCFAWDNPAIRAALIAPDPHSFQGWWSPYYQMLAPAVALKLTGPGSVAFDISYRPAA